MIKYCWAVALLMVSITTYADVIDTATNERLSDEDFVSQLSGLDYVILGEYHDSEIQHKKTLWLLQQLNDIRPQGSLLLEMLRVDQQPLVDKASQSPPMQLLNQDHLRQALAWDKSWSWVLYGDIVKEPFRHRYQLLATNLTKDEVQTLMQGAEPIRGYRSTTKAVQSAIKKSILTHHHMDNETNELLPMLDKMVQIQQFRDRRMAQKLIAAPTPSLLLAGNYHARKDIGVPLHLIDLQNKKHGVSVLMMDEVPLGDNRMYADYIWLVR